MPGLKDDPNKFRGEIGDNSSAVRSLDSVVSCLGAGGIPCWELLSQITSSDACFPQGMEDPAETPGARTCGKSPFMKCNQKFALKEFYQLWPCCLQSAKPHLGSAVPMDTWVRVAHASDKGSDRE